MIQVGDNLGDYAHKPMPLYKLLEMKVAEFQGSFLSVCARWNYRDVYASLTIITPMLHAFLGNGTIRWDQLSLNDLFSQSFLGKSLQSDLFILANTNTGEVISRQRFWSVWHGRERVGMDLRLVDCASHHRTTTQPSKNTMSQSFGVVEV